MNYDAEERARAMRLVYNTVDDLDDERQFTVALAAELTRAYEAGRASGVAQAVGPERVYREKIRGERDAAIARAERAMADAEASTSAWQAEEDAHASLRRDLAALADEWAAEWPVEPKCARELRALLNGDADE